MRPFSKVKALWENGILNKLIIIYRHSYANLTRIPWRYTGCAAKMNFPCQGFRKLSYYSLQMQIHCATPPTIPTPSFILPARQFSCSPSAWHNQPSETRYLRSFCQTFCHPTAQIWTQLTANYGRNVGAGLASSWRRWTDQRLINVWHRFKQSIRWWVAQMSLRVNVCESRTFWAFNSTSIMHIMLFSIPFC